MPKIVKDNSTCNTIVVESSNKFPKYTSQLINLANQTSKGARKGVVGQMSDLIPMSNCESLEEWIEWYSKQYPDAIDTATDIIYNMIVKFQQAINSIDKDMVNRWVKDLIFDKTYYGLKTQQIVIENIANQLGKDYRLATKEEESKGIDGFIGDKPIQIKPISHKAEKYLNQPIDIPILYYKKVGMTIELCDFDLSYFE